MIGLVVFSVISLVPKRFQPLPGLLFGETLRGGTQLFHQFIGRFLLATFSSIGFSSMILILT
jgi:hypothetical protein